MPVTEGAPPMVITILRDGNTPGIDNPMMLPQGRAAQWYRLHAGWGVIPVHGVDPITLTCTCGRTNCPSAGKHPISKAFQQGRWERYQHELVEPTTLLAWWQQGIRGRRWRADLSGVAIVTGVVSGLVVLDVDGPEGEAYLSGRELPVTPTVETGSGGRHYYFAHPGEEIRIPGKVRIAPGLDIRADGNYVVAPPSRHRSGRLYRWLDGRRPDEIPLAPIPRWLQDMLTRTPPITGQAVTGQAREGSGSGGTATPVENWVRLIIEGVQEGQRNDTAARLAGYLLRHGLPPAVVSALMLRWNQVNRPPLPDDELLRVVRSIAARDARRRGVTA